MKKFFDSNNHKFNSISSIIPYLIGSILLAYLVYRAIKVPITHDEAGTCLFFANQTIKDIVLYTVPIPNNHILNTLLIKLVSSILGMNTFTVRIPNLLGFIIYYLSVLGILKRLNNKFFFILGGIVLLTFNPYLLDFFSLARGYALSISFMTAAIYFAVCYLQTHSMKDLVRSTLISAVAVYTNFTILNFYVAFISLLGVVILLEYKSESLKSIGKKILVLFSTTIVLASISYIPIKKMVGTNQFIYWSSNGFYTDTVESLLKCSLYLQNYFDTPHIVYATILGTLFFLGFYLILPDFWQKKTFVINKSYQLFFLIIILTVTVNIVQFKVAGTPFLSTRTALFLYPLFALSMIGFISFLYIKGFKRAYNICLFIIIIGGSIHLGRTHNFTTNWEWWYDASTRDVLAYLKNEHKKNPEKEISLNTNWLFTPSFKFYIEIEKLDWLKIMPNHYDPQPDSPAEYYYTTSDEALLLEKKYERVEPYGYHARFLMKRKQ